MRDQEVLLVGCAGDVGACPVGVGGWGNVEELRVTEVEEEGGAGLGRLEGCLRCIYV